MYQGSFKRQIESVAKEFINDCIEINNQVIKNSKLVDGFLISESISVKPNIEEFSAPDKVNDVILETSDNNFGYNSMKC